MSSTTPKHVTTPTPAQAKARLQTLNNSHHLTRSILSTTRFQGNPTKKRRTRERKRLLLHGYASKEHCNPLQSALESSGKERYAIPLVQDWAAKWGVKPPKIKEQGNISLVLPDFDVMDANVRVKSRIVRELLATRGTLSYFTLCERPEPLARWQPAGVLILGDGLWTFGLPYMEIQVFLGPGSLRKRTCFSFPPLIYPWIVFPWGEASRCELYYASKALHQKWVLPWEFRQFPFITSVRYMCRIPLAKQSQLASLSTFNITLFSTHNNESVSLQFCMKSSKASFATACSEPLFDYATLKKRYPDAIKVCPQHAACITDTVQEYAIRVVPIVISLGACLHDSFSKIMSAMRETSGTTSSMHETKLFGKNARIMWYAIVNTFVLSRNTSSYSPVCWWRQGLLPVIVI